MIDPHRPILGEPGTPCRACGSALAEDQRYCLSCGERRAETRLPFLEILAGQRPEPPQPTVPVSRRTGARERVERFSSNTAAIAGIGCLLLAVGVGVLIGQGSNDTAQSTPPPQVISVGGAGAATSTDAAADTSADSSTSTSKKKSSDSNTATSKAASKATNPALKALDSTSGSDYAKKAAKLPKTVGTGGKAPPKDNKAPAGGGSFEEIQ